MFKEETLGVALSWRLRIFVAPRGRDAFLAFFQAGIFFQRELIQWQLPLQVYWCTFIGVIQWVRIERINHLHLKEFSCFPYIQYPPLSIWKPNIFVWIVNSAWSASWLSLFVVNNIWIVDHYVYLKCWYELPLCRCSCVLMSDIQGLGLPVSVETVKVTKLKTLQLCKWAEELKLASVDDGSSNDVRFKMNYTTFMRITFYGTALV